MLNGKLVRQFRLLKDEAVLLESNKSYGGSRGTFVDDDEYRAWKAKAKNLLTLACGVHSEHFKAFEHNEKADFGTNHSTLLRLMALLNGARQDYEGGLCNSLRSIIQSDVFDTELEQAEELLKASYITAAAVIAGVVLETTIRQLCDDEGIAHGKLDKMNADLTKAGRYSSLVQKQVTALAAIRNSAAHGKTDEYNRGDVERMITDVARFVREHL